VSCAANILENALENALPPIRVHVGRQSVLDGIAAGRLWCKSSARQDSDA